MLNDTTDFIGNAIGIDPSGCGCTDCIVGHSIPEDSSSLEELLRAHVEEGRGIVNRTYASTLLVYRDRNGSYRYESLYLPDSNAEVEIIEEQEQYRDDYGIVLFDSYQRTAEYVIQSYGEDAEEVRAVDVNDSEALSNALDEHFRNGVDITNRTHSTLIIHESYGEYGHVLIDPYEGTEISIIR